MDEREGRIGYWVSGVAHGSLILWAILLGILMFGEWPDLWMLVGSAVVVATGLFTLYRERQVGLKKPPVAPEPPRPG